MRTIYRVDALSASHNPFALVHFRPEDAVNVPRRRHPTPSDVLAALREVAIEQELDRRAERVDDADRDWCTAWVWSRRKTWRAALVVRLRRRSEKTNAFFHFLALDAQGFV
uniref:Uncharacterized protein n=1 Tax=Marseillevirus LCMAC103 TaxID=2506604 RepID=A0A481YVY4_9VIRU|nr:MAG: hypothetical protein LCMAC103_04050 [Marseillevirus LCMAC103]